MITITVVYHWAWQVAVYISQPVLFTGTVTPCKGALEHPSNKFKMYCANSQNWESLRERGEESMMVDSSTEHTKHSREKELVML